MFSPLAEVVKLLYTLPAFLEQVVLFSNFRSIWSNPLTHSMSKGFWVICYRLVASSDLALGRCCFIVVVYTLPTSH